MEASENPETEDPPLDWMTQTKANSDNLLESGNLFSSNFWENGSGDATPEASAFPDTRFVAVAEGIVEGESLDMGSTKIHSYKIVGHSERPNKGSVTIEVGYLKAF
jgi:hypothetical protein